ncbi:MAG: phosphohistidine phosphatase SixA [Gammaproteobacteria bacterium]|nr:phosphohistidine phosphatase SixA [Gammaproteobacteria bacterium]
MALYLVQHGKSHSKETDPERGLTGEGASEAKLIASMAAKYGVRVNAIKHSGKKRTRQTAEIFASALRPADEVQQMSGLNPMDDVSALAVKLSPGDDMMLVGHLPFMEKITSYLITDSADKRILKFQNSGIVCLDTDPEGGPWFVKWTLLPKIA